MENSPLIMQEDIDKERLVEFVKFVKNELGIKITPTIKLLNGRGELKTTAHYNYSSLPTNTRTSIITILL